MNALTELVTNNSRAVAYQLVEPLSRFLAVAQELCDGDLQQVVLMVAVSLRSSAHPKFRSLAEAELHRRMVLPGFGTNMRSLAASTGIPRETVRRKVELLLERGWVAWDHRTLHYTTCGYRAVAPARAALVRLHARGFQIIASLKQNVS